jgi:hypothetical protein
LALLLEAIHGALRWRPSTKELIFSVDVVHITFPEVRTAMSLDWRTPSWDCVLSTRCMASIHSAAAASLKPPIFKPLRLWYSQHAIKES